MLRLAICVFPRTWASLISRADKADSLSGVPVGIPAMQKSLLERLQRVRGIGHSVVHLALEGRSIPNRRRETPRVAFR